MPAEPVANRHLCQCRRAALQVPPVIAAIAQQHRVAVRLTGRTADVAWRVLLRRLALALLFALVRGLVIRRHVASCATHRPEALAWRYDTALRSFDSGLGLALGLGRWRREELNRRPMLVELVTDRGLAELSLEMRKMT